MSDQDPSELSESAAKQLFLINTHLCHYYEGQNCQQPFLRLYKRAISLYHPDKNASRDSPSFLGEVVSRLLNEAKAKIEDWSDSDYHDFMFDHIDWKSEPLTLIFDKHSFDSFQRNIERPLQLEIVTLKAENESLHQQLQTQQTQHELIKDELKGEIRALVAQQLDPQEVLNLKMFKVEYSHICAQLMDANTRNEHQSSLISCLTKSEATIRKAYEQQLTTLTDTITLNQCLQQQLKESKANEQFAQKTAIDLENKVGQLKSQLDLNPIESHKQRFICTLCPSYDHLTTNCPVFVTPQDRLDRFKVQRVCQNCCLWSFHELRLCRSQKNCSICHERHHTMLHGASGLEQLPIPTWSRHESMDPYYKAAVEEIVRIHTS